LIGTRDHAEFWLPNVDFSLPNIDFRLPNVDHGLPHVDFRLPHNASNAPIFVICPPISNHSAPHRVKPPPFAALPAVTLARRGA